MKGASGALGVSRSAAAAAGHENSEPKTKKQRLLTNTNSADQYETDEELYQKAVSLVFGGELYAKLLSYGGPEAIAHFRDDDKWRRAMDDLSEADKKALKLPSVPRPSDMDLTLLRGLLTEPISSPHTGRRGAWALNTLGRMALVESSLSSNKAIEGLIHEDCGRPFLWSIAIRKSCSVSVLTKLVETNNANIFGPLSGHPNATSEILSALLLRSFAPGDANRSKERVAANVAMHKNAGQLDLLFLARNEAADIRSCVARGTTETKILHSLASDSEAVVRAAVAGNKHTAQSDLVNLSIDKRASVRASLASNPNITRDVILALTRDCDRKILYSLARNPTVDVDVTFNDEIKDHQIFLAKFSKDCRTLEKLIRSDDVEKRCRYNVATNKNVTATVLEILAGDENKTIRHVVAAHHNTSSEVFGRLSNDDVCKVTLARNSNVPLEILEALAKDTDVDVRRAVGSNVSAPQDVLERMLSSGEFDDEIYRNESLPLDSLIKYLEGFLSRNEEIDYEFEEAFWDRIDAEGFDLPVDLLVSMSKSSSNESLRWHVASDPKLPVIDIVLLSRETYPDSGDINETLRSNPLIQVAVDKLSRLLSREGFGSSCHFENGENWW